MLAPVLALVLRLLPESLLVLVPAPAVVLWLVPESLLVFVLQSTSAALAPVLATLRRNSRDSCLLRVAPVDVLLFAGACEVMGLEVDVAWLPKGEVAVEEVAAQEPASRSRD